MYVCMYVCMYMYSLSIHLWRDTSYFCVLVIVNSAAWIELLSNSVLSLSKHLTTLVNTATL